MTTDPDKHFLQPVDAYDLLWATVAIKMWNRLGHPFLRRIFYLVVTIGYNKSYVASDHKDSLAGSVVKFA